MKDMLTVFRFEFSNWIRKKSFWIITIIVLIIMLIVTTVPSLLSIGSDSESADAAVNETISFGYCCADSLSESEKVSLASLPILNRATEYQDENALRQAVEQSDIDRGFFLESATSFRMITRDVPLSDTTAAIFSEQLRQLRQNEFLSSLGLSASQVQSYRVIQVDYQVEALGSDASSGFAFAYIGTFVIFLLISFYSGFVATMVAREKNDRTMEILITNTPSSNLILGKVGAATVLSSLQMILIVAAAALGILLNRESYSPELLSALKGGISGSDILVFLLFGITGTVLYYFIFAAIGALADKMEEADQLLMPVRLLFMLSFFASVLCLFAGSDGLTRVVSCIPFSSPIAMFVRVVISTVPLHEILISYAILLITTAMLAALSIRIYAIGVLNYGNRMTLRRACQLTFQKNH